MSATSPAPAIRSLYRRFLRELPSRAPEHTILSGPSPLQRHVRSSFSRTQQDSGGAAAAGRSRVQEAEEYANYMRAQRMYLTLVERYNPGSNMSTEERVRLTARKVGMDLPVGGTGKGGLS